MNRKTARRARIKKSKIVLVNKKLFVIIGIVAIVITSIFVLLFAVFSSNWNGLSRLSLAILEDDGVEVVVLDPGSHKLVTVFIPGNTIVEAANQMGQWPLSSIEQLAKNEGHTNDFISQTITKSFYLPVENWATKDAKNLIGNNFLASFLATLTPFDTDLTFSDKIKIAWNSSSIDSVDRYRIDLSKTNYLREVKLVDGSNGYQVNTSGAASVKALFADEGVSKESAKILLLNNTGSNSFSKNITEVVEVMGGKVFSINNGDKNMKDCEVWGNKPLTVTKISSVFNCNMVTKDPKSFDVILEIGESFKNRY